MGTRGCENTSDKETGGTTEKERREEEQVSAGGGRLRLILAMNCTWLISGMSMN